MIKDKTTELIAAKLKIARKGKLKIGQKDIESSVNIKQSSISGLESAMRESIPLKYLMFLAENGINLSAIFNNNVSLEDYSAICEGKSMLLLPAHVDCANCKIKDQTIIDLRDTIKILKDNIELLNK